MTKEIVRNISGKSSDNAEAIGQDIRQLRKARKMTLSQLSEKIDLSISFLSQIERGISSPTIESMFDISHALGVNVGWFFHSKDDQGMGQSRYIVRADKRQSLSFETGITDQLLNTKSIQNLQVLLSVFDPGASSGDSYYSHEGEECGIILEGQLEISIDDQVFILKKNDSFSFPSTLKHSYKNPGSKETKVIWCMSPPSY